MFLRRAALFTAGAAAYLLPAARSEAFLFRRKQYKVVKTRLLMGTFVSMTAIHASRDAAEDAIGEAFLLVERLGRILSRHDQESPLALLNRQGHLDDPPADLLAVILRGQHWNVQSRGAFDITVKPLVDLYEMSFADNLTPDDRAIERALALTGGKWLSVSPSRLSVQRPQMGLTLDGIAKGYIVDEASNLLQARGIDNHLVNAGGDMRARGRAAMKKPWTIAIEDPEKRHAYPQLIRMGDGAIATSGNYEIFYDEEKLFHHIVDPATGRSPQGAVSATVAAPTVIDADALATAAMVLGPAHGPSLCNRLPGCSCLLLDAAGRQYPSTDWRADQVG